MRYSQEDNYEDDEEINKYFNEDDEFDEKDFIDRMDEKFFYENQKVKILKLAVKQQELRRKLLIDSIKTLQKSFWWNFFSWETKLTYISRTYGAFAELIFGSQEKKNEDDDSIEF